MELTSKHAFFNLRRNQKGRRYPSRQDQRYADGLLFPAIYPKFNLSNVRKVFTIGSCFAREIETKLQGSFYLPTQRFTAPTNETDDLTGRPDLMLNEYNPGTMSQRLQFAISGRDYPEGVIVENDEGFWDLSLHVTKAVSFERAMQRRAEIASIYHELNDCDLVIITLGLVECWFDKKLDVYLNRMPVQAALKREPERYTVRILDVFDALPLLVSGIKPLLEMEKKILLTVSPVPLQSTFSDRDAVTANAFSKSVLRVCAERLTRMHPLIDYFPSYEIVTSGGTQTAQPDNVHVKPEVVHRVTEYMLDAYRAAEPATTP